MNPLVAFKLSNRVSLSVGLQAQYLDAKISNAIDFGTIGMIYSIPGSNPGTSSQDGFVKINGDDWGLGWTAGMLVELTEQTRIGLAFRSAISHDLQGHTHFTWDPQGIGALVNAASGTFVDSDASVRLETPELLTLSIRHDINSMWSLMAELDLTRWSRLDQLEIQFSNMDQNNNVTAFEWSDTWFGSLGIEYRSSDRWRIRSGLAYEEGTTSNQFRTPGIPDDDRIWVSFGGTYSYNRFNHIHAAFTHIVMKNPKVDLDAAFPLNTDDENVFRGNLSGKFDSDINILAVGITINF
jgi:long-chain fatty acid transport protein